LRSWGLRESERECAFPFISLGRAVDCALSLLANISYRVGRKLEFDPAAERFKDSDANALLARAYRKPYTIQGS